MNKIFSAIIVAFLLISCNSYQPIVNYSNQNVLISEQSASNNMVIEEFIKPYRDSLNEEMMRVIAYSTEEMQTKKPESNLTNFMADFLLEEAKAYCADKGMEIPQVSYINYRGLRAKLPKGDIKVQNVFEMIPFDNELVILKLTGENFYRFADIVASRDGECVSGIKMGIKDGKLSTLKVNGEEFDKNKSYWLVTNDYVANGGDYMVMFKSPLKYHDSNLVIRNLFIKYLEELTKEGKMVKAEKDGRVYYE